MPNLNTWKKCPSVFRENKFFYSKQLAGRIVNIVQSTLTGKWTSSDFPLNSFKTAKEAMAYVERTKA